MDNVKLPIKKYCTILKLFVSRFYLGNNQVPNNITIVTDVLSNNILDPKFYENKIDKRSHKIHATIMKNIRTAQLTFIRKMQHAIFFIEKRHIELYFPKI